MKFACFSAALLSVVMQEHTTNALQLEHRQHAEDEGMVEMGQTWTDAGSDDFEDYLLAEANADKSKSKKTKSPEKAKAKKDEKKKVEAGKAKEKKTAKKAEKSTEMKKAAKKKQKKDGAALKDSESSDSSSSSDSDSSSSSSDYVDDSPEGRHANMLKAIKHSKLDAGVVKQATECNKH
jgi:hypothetical protein